MKPHYSLYLGEETEEYSEEKLPQHKFPIKMGQRKLFFITYFFLKNLPPGNVLYAGAAGGNNLVTIMKIFPEHNYYLFDPGKFCNKLVKAHGVKKFAEPIEPGVHIYGEYFTTEICRVFAEVENVYFISDVRTGSEETQHIDVPLNMEWQREWYWALKPARAMLKFRLPWEPGTTKYLAGDILLQPRTGNKSAESRLIVIEPAEIEWDHHKYNNRIYYFHTYNRASYHAHKLNLPGICHCWDCWAEIQILGNKVNKYWGTIAKFIGDTNKPPHNMFPHERNTARRLELCAEQIELNIRRKIDTIIPREGEKVYILTDGTEVLKPGDYYIPGEEKVSNMEKYKVPLDTLSNEFEMN